jgi:TPR repeat protein
MNRLRQTPPAWRLLWLLVLAGCADSDPHTRFQAGDYHASFKTFRRMADSGDMAAGNFVGIHYYLGAGVERDFAAAARWFEQAALTGNADAQRNLGTLYLRGWGVPRDYEHAYGWLYLAYTQGNARARHFLEVTEHMITPNQTMAARKWVARQMAAAAPRAR